MRDHLNAAVDETFVENMQVADLFKMLESTLASLNGYISYLKKCAADAKIKQPSMGN